ncbi:MAG: OFA family MFS transporter [Archaeoglobaceae archaeon]
MNRWLFILAGLIINICLGAIYAYSVLQVPIKKLFEAPPPQGFGLKVTATEMQLPFITFLALFAFTMPLVGKFIEKYGPRKVAIVGGIVVGLGWFLASFATSPLSLVFLYGVIGGLGVGIAYNCPIVTSGRWFPDRRGLALGLTILGFGISPLITAPLIDYFTAIYGIQNALKILGVIFTVLILIFASILRFPPADWKPEGWTPPAGTAPTSGLLRHEMVRTRAFYGLWLCYTIGTLAGLLAIGVAKPVGLEVAKNIGISEAEISAFLTGLVGVFACCNGFGRPLFGWITDKIKPVKAAILSYILIIIASMAIYNNQTSLAVYAISFAILWLNLGGWLAIAPAATASLFGMKDYARNYGLVFTAYGAGAIIGNILVGQAKDIFGAYIAVFPIVASLAALGILLAITLMRPKKS